MIATPSECQSDAGCGGGFHSSFERTREVALRYPGVKVVDEPTPGIVWARARGFAESTGELVANVDADNMLTPGWLSFTLDEFDRDPRLVNQYSVMLVNPARHPEVKAALGMAFIDWLTSQQGQNAIASYKVDGEQLFFPNYAGS